MEELPNEVYEDQGIRDVSDISTDYTNTLESLNTDLTEAKEGVTEDMIKDAVENQANSNIDLIDKINETITGDSTSTLDLADVESIKELSGKIKTLQSQGKTLGESTAELKDQENKISDDGIVKIKKPIQNMANNIKNNLEKIVDGTEGSEKTNEVNEKSKKVQNATETLNNAIESGEAEAINAAERELNSAVKALKDLLEKLKGIDNVVEGEGSNLKKILLSMLMFFAKSGTLFLILWIISKQITGCYLFQGGNRAILDNCSSWYSTGNNKTFCSCNTKADMNNYRNPNCANLQTDCKQPYCLGIIGCDTTLPNCQYPDGIRLQCNTEGDLTKSDAIYYSYQDYSPLSIINQLFQLGTDLANEIPKLPQDIGALLQAILKYMGIFFGVIVGMYILFQVIQIIFSKIRRPS